MKYLIYFFNTHEEGIVIASSEIEALRKWHLFINANCGEFYKRQTYHAQKILVL